MRGFTLIELLIALVIVALIATLAYPLLTSPNTRGHRALAQTALLTAAQDLEHYHTENGRYSDANGNAPALPSLTAAVPEHEPHYQLSVTVNASEDDYQLSATPLVAEPECGTLSLDDTGLRNCDGTACTAQNGQACWGR